MKKSLVAFALFVFSVCAFGQAPAPASTLPANFYAAGVSYNVGASPQVAGTGLYAHLVSADLGTYAFGVIDALPVSVRPFTVTTNVGTGIAQKVFTIGKVNVYVPSAAGISFSGTNTGWAWSTGGMVAIPVKNSVRIMPMVRVLKSSISGGAGYQPIVGLLVGWGK